MRYISDKMFMLCWMFLAAALVAPGIACSEEIRLYDNSRIYGLVRGVNDKGEVTVLQPSGEEQRVPLENIVSIRFLGRNPLLVQSGTQEFRFINGGALRGQILYNEGDLVRIQTAMAGIIDINLAHIRGFVALPLSGFSGRKAEELVDSQQSRIAPSLDVVLDRRGSAYAGVVRKLDRTQLDLDHEDLLQVVPVRIMYIAGVRMADATRAPRVPWKSGVQVRIRGRDESLIQGTLKKIYLGRWYLSPAWDPKSTLEIDVEEISLVQVLGGRLQYLSQLEPEKVEESTVLAPPQPYKINRSSQGDAISIAGKRYPWGIGVHADSELTFDLGGRFKEFRSDVGISTRIGERGSAIFSVIGDGKVLHKTKVISGSAEKPESITSNVSGVKKLTLKVTNGGNLDLGDVANWGSARVLR